MATTVNNYLALGCADGAVRFYDFFLRLESWFEDISGGAVTSLSFSLESNPYDEKEAGTPGLKFWVPNFTIGTADALVVGASGVGPSVSCPTEHDLLYLHYHSLC
jgi:hypothetical protein